MWNPKGNISWHTPWGERSVLECMIPVECKSCLSITFMLPGNINTMNVYRVKINVSSIMRRWKMFYILPVFRNFMREKEASSNLSFSLLLFYLCLRLRLCFIFCQLENLCWARENLAVTRPRRQRHFRLFFQVHFHSELSFHVNWQIYI